MKNPVLVLQYPDPRHGRTVAIAATRSPKALRAFKDVVLKEARDTAMDSVADELLRVQDKAELERLQVTLDLLIPE
jgi:hypothetical protein